MEPAGGAVGIFGDEGAGDVFGEVPFGLFGGDFPADFKHDGMVALRGRDIFELGFGLGGITQFEPALGGAGVVEVGIFERFHDFVIIDLKWETGSGKGDA